MKRKLLSLALCLVLIAATFCVLAACDKKDETDYEITVWVGEGTKTLTEQQIAAFNETNEWGVKFNATVEIVSESKAVGDAVSKPADSADLFCFAQDQLARAVQSNLLAGLNTASVEFISQNSDADAVEAATVGNSVRAFPMTADNGYFMYYDKTKIKQSSIGDLDSIIADCRAEGVNFSMNLTSDGGWYAASFFYATGCHSNWDTDENGAFVDYDDTFDSDAGIIALKGMKKIFGLGDNYVEKDKVSDFNAGTPSGVVISGIWDYEAAKKILGDNLGIAPLPSFTVDGQSYQLTSFLGHKFMGVKPQSDAHRAYYLQKLAMYLTGKECQKQRFEEVGWGPSNKELKADETVTSEALKALEATKKVNQGQYPTNWWAKMDVMTQSARTSSDLDNVLKGLLQTYSATLPDLIK